MGTRGVSRGRRNRYAQFGLDRTRSRRPTTSKLCPITRTPKQSKVSNRGWSTSAASTAPTSPRHSLSSANQAGPSAVRASLGSRETYFLVRAIDGGLERSSRMRSDIRQTRAPVFHKQAQALAFPFLSLKEEVYKFLLK